MVLNAFLSPLPKHLSAHSVDFSREALA
jgi:hypothetical protein